MTTPTTNLTMTNIQTEFTGLNPISLSEYYRGGTYVPTNQATSATDGTPITAVGGGAIRMGMFRGLTITPQVSYSVSPATGSVNEGSTDNFTVTTTGVANGTTLYWTIANGTTSNADFSSVFGSFTINSNSGSFFVQPIADSTTEGAETFTVQIRTGSTSGTVVATSSSVTVNDTSTTPSGGIVTGYSDAAAYSDPNAIATCTYSFAANGTITVVDNNGVSAFPPNWYSPTTTGIGNSYWIRFTQTAIGANSVRIGTFGSWLPLSSPKTAGVQTSLLYQTSHVAFTAQISTNSAGTNIVATWTLDCTAYSGVVQ